MKAWLEPLAVVAALLIVAFGLIVIFEGCTPAPAPASLDGSAVGDAAPVLDGGDAFDRACATMATLGCVEGRSPYCAVSMRRAEEQLSIVFDAACLGAAHSKADVRACKPSGAVECP